MARVAVPRLLLFMLGGYWAYYQLKYHPNVSVHAGVLQAQKLKSPLLQIQSYQKCHLFQA